jgi:hypothetical protein
MADKPIFEFAPIEGDAGIPVNVDQPTLGLFLCSGPSRPPEEEEKSNHYSNLNFTGKPGTASGLYYSLVFQLPKWGWWIPEKVDEWIEVSPTHKEYYERTMTTKQILESTIKTGLTSAAQAVADFELMNHDIRKYREILGYFARNDEHSLKAMFVDQVDVHTDMPGQPISMRSVVARWPTLIADFMKLTDKDVEPDKIAKKFEISKAEGVILATKNKLYQEWKNLFRNAAKDRYELLKGLVGSRRKSIIEYKEWLKPYIARFKMTKLGGERPSGRSKALRSFADITGMSTFTNSIRLFTWRPLKTGEVRRPAAEVKKDFVVYPYDDFIKENYVLNTSNGLAAIYPWLMNDRKYCEKCKRYFSPTTMQCDKCGSINLINKKYADEIVEKQIIPAWKRKEMNLDPFELYYQFLDIDVFRAGTRLPVGELEDITFNIKSFTISQNVLLVKILELKCRDMELERYIDEMLGIKLEERDMVELVREEFPGLFPAPKKVSEWKSYIKGVKENSKAYFDFLGKIRLPKTRSLMFFKSGPYERDFKDRISKHYLTVASAYFNVITDFLKTKMGVQ